MRLGRVIGKIWASVKDPKLEGTTLYIMQTVNEANEPLGMPVIAVDTVGAREGDLIYWVGGGDATVPFEDRMIPSDVTIVGIVDHLQIKRDAK
ncbi:EutN/CcmL family microcompartment protein [Caldithrix abyssi]|uniref:Ethanolamine utilization protein EutN n=1 Tax=Caldithrix abyssi DSM 13497 TaxID=880073 RepID=H1XWQ9_CALAY|nr:EutN/CcmL family microcompartment protein [Caldithrix abyssi]APF19100.1 ethanolamine utilization protein EutN [Caldithrix abyssi DSM 13497]EHO43035.1 Ethanolamine utilization protein EutN/carboxysome structural protein Ccml [Caldithrix abyssi DSM 13497]